MMEPFSMVVAIVAIGCGTGLAVKFMETAQAIFTSRPRKGDTELLHEVHALREEIRQLRSVNNDVVLTLDTTVQRIDRRIGHLESRVSLGAGTSVEEPAEQLVARR
ncbi:MAG TPA: hypothetical protein VK689_12375 [Armatimonadota bacterium]|nr:hypothetical protein [Armatimonadota bacterium]